MGRGKVLKIKDGSIPILYLILVVPIFIALLAQFNIIDLSMQTSSTLTVLAGLFVMSEVGIMSMIKKKHITSPMNLFGAIVAGIAIVAASLNMAGITFSALMPFMGIINGLVLVYIFVTAFTN